MHLLNSPAGNLQRLVVFIICLNFYPTVSTAKELPTVPFVDLKRYSGKWFEIASYPQRFQKGCRCTTAEYTYSESGPVLVENKCTRNNNGRSGIKGKAFVEKNSGNAKLKVQFFWPFRGKYWIIDLAEDYSYAVVSHPNRKYLWILSRSPRLNPEVYKGIISRLEVLGFDLSKIRLTDQDCADPKGSQ